ncbi:MAG: YihY/virulence factor BrkB family protein, partial [Hyphomicrobiales bacterium]
MSAASGSWKPPTSRPRWTGAARPPSPAGRRSRCVRSTETGRVAVTGTGRRFAGSSAMDQTLPKPRVLARIWSTVTGTVKAFLDPDVSLRCAGTAFFGFLSLFPAVGIVVFAYGLVADVSTFMATIETLRYLVPSAVLDVLREQLAILVNQPPAALSIGLAVSIVLALWSGSRGVSALIYAMSRVREEPERRGFIKTVIISVLLTVGGAIFLSIALITIAGLPALIPFPSGEGLLVLVLRWPVLLALTTAVLGALYRWGPD